MNLDYFLFLVKEYEKILIQLNEVINIYDNLISRTNKENEFYNDLNLTYNQHLEQKTILMLSIEKCKNHIDDLCCHNYVSDFIDLTPDRSENIKYCILCGNTKKC